MKSIKEETENLIPILIVENLTYNVKIAKKDDQKISQCEEILLTLIAEIIVEIILNEEV